MCVLMKSHIYTAKEKIKLRKAQTAQNFKFQTETEMKKTHVEAMKNL